VKLKLLLPNSRILQVNMYCESIVFDKLARAVAGVVIFGTQQLSIHS
jgi:hypothetical protein